MAITYPLTFPIQGVGSAVLGMRSNVSVVRSPFTGQEQVQVHQGHMWEYSASYPPMIRADAEVIISFLGKLGGQEGTFLAGDPNGVTARGVATGTPLVNGSSQTGTDLILDGATINTTGWLLEGDYISLGTGVQTHLHKVLTNADSNGSGDVTLTLWPRLRESPVTNDAITVASCTGTFRLTNNLSEFSVDTAKHYGLQFEAVESIQVI